MNPLLQVKLHFSKEQNNQKPGIRNLRQDAKISSEKIGHLINNLQTIEKYYKEIPCILHGFLIDVNYNDIIAKSRRIQEVLKPNNRKANDLIVGARFSDAPEGEENHIITYYVDEYTLHKTITELKIAQQFISEKLSGYATSENFNEPNNKISYERYALKKTNLRNIIVDCSVIESFSVPNISTTPSQESFLITFYKTELSVEKIFEKLDIDNYHFVFQHYGENTISASKELFEILNEKIPYLMSMVASDISKINLSEIGDIKKLEKIEIPSPSNEPTIGVIDTLFDESVYFSEWVDNNDYLEDFEKSNIDIEHKIHGTEVTSLIVDGPRMNPWLDDGCGRFKVRHFGVCADRISTPRLIKKIKEIISHNSDIHVWNLSLGTEEEVSKNYISYDASILDELQSQNNIVFVISGTNDNREDISERIRVGSPADSLNSIVVNSVRKNGHPASYSRKGNILSFFNKPDISYYGGDYDERIMAYSPHCGANEVFGTSFAAPWISRKMCYLIDIMGIPREIAKALIIDSAAGWNYKLSNSNEKDLIGYGIPPIDISKIVSSGNGEIKFVLYGASESYKTTNYSIPIPKDENNRYPFIARATLCYFPECSRLQGVDYTNRELSIQFGRIKSNGKIDDINENQQDDMQIHIDERKSRKEFRKWENTKFISKVERNNQPLKSYDERMWGISVTSKERLRTNLKNNLNFGVVITLKEISGINRIQDFIKACTLRGWIVNELKIENQVDVYNSAQEELLLD